MHQFIAMHLTSRLARPGPAQPAAASRWIPPATDIETGLQNGGVGESGPLSPLRSQRGLISRKGGHQKEVMPQNLMNSFRRNLFSRNLYREVCSVKYRKEDSDSGHMQKSWTFSPPNTKIWDHKRRLQGQRVQLPRQESL